MTICLVGDYEKEQYQSDQLMYKYQENSIVNVLQSPFNAKGDGITDDTVAIQSAINYCSDSVNKCKTVYFPYGSYVFSNLTITSDITLKMDIQQHEYTVGWGGKVNYKLLRKPGSTGNGIDGTGGHPHFENMRIDGNFVTGYCLYNIALGKDIFIFNADIGLGLATGALIENLYITSCLNAGLMFLSGSADNQIHTFNIWSNFGDGIVFNGGGSTTRFENGKSEWNWKNNVHVQGFTDEIFWDHCILDSANWFNLFVDVSPGYADHWLFTNCYIKGGRRNESGVDSGSGRTFPTQTVYTGDMSQLRLAGYSRIGFSGCFFKSANGGSGVSNVTSIVITDSNLTNNKIIIDVCEALDFTLANIVKNCVSTVISNSWHSDMLYNNTPTNSGQLQVLMTANSQSLITIASGLPSTFSFFDWTSKKTITRYSSKYYDAMGTQALLNGYDTFARTDSLTALGTPSDAGTNWSALAGTWGISANKSFIVTPSGGIDLAVIDRSLADCKVSVTLSVITGNPSIAFRATDANNFFYIRADSANYTLHRVTASVDSGVLATYGTVSTGDYVKVILSGSSIKFQLNNGTASSSTVDTANQTATKHGIAGNNTASRFSNFIIDAG